MVWLVNELLTQDETFFDPTFNSTGLKISIETLQSLTWVRAGYLNIYLLEDGELYYWKAQRLNHGNSIVTVNASTPYKLSFAPGERFGLFYNARIKIAPFNMSISYPSVDRETGAVTTVSKPVAVVSTELAPVDLNRHSGTIYNNTNKNVGIAFGASAATLAKPSKIIPAGGNLRLYDDYTGTIQYIVASGANAASDVQIETVSYV